VDLFFRSLPTSVRGVPVFNSVPAPLIIAAWFATLAVLNVAAKTADWQRLEREREGGGAPSERKFPKPVTAFARWWRRFWRP
jgi:hypothetical protein